MPAGDEIRTKTCPVVRHFLPPWIKVTSAGEAGSPSISARREPPLVDEHLGGKCDREIVTGASVMIVVGLPRSVHVVR